MRDPDPALVDLLRARRGVDAHLLLWIVARDRTTGVPVTHGFTSSVEDMTVSIDGSARVYAAAGGGLRADPVVAETGMSVRMQTLRLSGVAAEVEAALRGAEPRLDPADLHRLVIDPATGASVGVPQLLFRGTLDAAPIRTPEKGGTVSVILTLASATRDMTRTLPLRWSDESQQRRHRAAVPCRFRGQGVGRARRGLRAIAQDLPGGGGRGGRCLPDPRRPARPARACHHR